MNYSESQTKCFKKGPILASVFAVHELLKEGLLNVNVIFLIEGEEESGSHGFLEALAKHQVKPLSTLKY